MFILTCVVENQPVYDEFGSVLLLVSTIRHRFDLDLADLGILASGSFVSHYFGSACESRSIDVLTAHENELLRGWIRGLFESEGINDELMSMCKPAEFHLLVATLFDQSVKACQTRVLALETLTGSFECMPHAALVYPYHWLTNVDSGQQIFLNPFSFLRSVLASPGLPMHSGRPKIPRHRSIPLFRPYLFSSNLHPCRPTRRPCTVPCSLSSPDH